jgi:hypothetical protein
MRRFKRQENQISSRFGSKLTDGSFKPKIAIGFNVEPKIAIGLSADNDTYQFNFESIAEFTKAAPIIVERFKKEGCWDLIEMPAHVNILDPVTNIKTPILETTFDKVKPTSTNIVNQKLEAEKSKYKKELDDACKYINELRNNEDINTESMRTFMAAENHLYIKNMTRIDELRMRYEAEFIPIVSIWAFEKKMFEAKAAACMRVFMESVGPEARNHIDIWLTRGEFRRAWYELNALYGADKKAHNPDPNNILTEVMCEDNDEDFSEYISYIDDIICTSKTEDNSNHNLNNPKLYPPKIYTVSKPCTTCGKTGHIASKCWSNVKCNICSKMGHPTERCRLLLGYVVKGSKKRNRAYKSSNIVDPDTPKLGKNKVSFADNFVANLKKKKTK